MSYLESPTFGQVVLQQQFLEDVSLCGVVVDLDLSFKRAEGVQIVAGNMGAAEVVRVLALAEGVLLLDGVLLNSPVPQILALLQK